MTRNRTLLIGMMFVAATATAFATAKSAVSKKRGVSDGGTSAAALNAGWYYNWYIRPDPNVKAEFVPMIAHGKDANSWYFDRIMELKREGKITALLGFNEPERQNFSVDDAINAWPMFEKTGLRLGSPAPAMDNAGRAWLTEFMKKAATKHLRVDFVCVHWYGDVAGGAASAKQFADWLIGIHKQYHKPIWITEFAGLNWGWLHHPITDEENQQFLAALEPQMQRTPWIERYCWFDSKPANLFTDKTHTSLTRLGMIYRDGG